MLDYFFFFTPVNFLLFFFSEFKCHMHNENALCKKELYLIKKKLVVKDTPSHKFKTTVIKKVISDNKKRYRSAYSDCHVKTITTHVSKRLGVRNNM